MRKIVKAAAFVAGLMAVSARPALAGGAITYNICGGNTFVTCASVNVLVVPSLSNPGKYTVTMQVYNLSGLNGTYAGTVFTSVGLDNVVPTSINVVAGSLRVTGPCYASASGCDYSSQWALQNDKSIGGGIKVDLLASSGNSQYSIASQCGVDANQTPGHHLYFVTSCAPGGPNFTTIKFDVTGDFNPAGNGDLFIKGQNGPGGQSTECITGLGKSNNCGTSTFPPPASTVPEPATIALVGSGLIAMGLASRRRKSELA